MTTLGFTLKQREQANKFQPEWREPPKDVHNINLHSSTNILIIITSMIVQQECTISTHEDRKLNKRKRNTRSQGMIKEYA
jgi:hypothetical protein